jgi:PKD repeat protein
MKNISLVLASLVLIGTGIQAQNRIGFRQDRASKPTPVNSIVKSPEIRSAYTLQPIQPIALKTLTSLQDPDTLNFPLTGEYSLYLAQDGGYVSGNNSYGDLAKANIFEYGSNSMLTGVLIDFAVATPGSTMIEIAAWNNTGSNSPGDKIASTEISIGEINQDISNNQTTYIPFDPPVMMPSTFYVGVVLPSGADTVAIFTNTDGDTQPATAWELWNTNQWFRYDDNNSWGFNLAHAIFPIVDSDVGITANFFADETQVLPGTMVSFFDSSTGDPVSWDWSFEGGQPETSEEQNPVITYAEEGLFDVTLIVSDGETQDTLIRTEYIFVTNEVPVETDTLNFPLEGTKTLYTISPNGGYVCGSNVFNDLAKANYFNQSEDIKISGLLIDFAVAKGGNPNIEIAVWNNNGEGGSPGATLTTETVPLNTIKSNISNNTMTYVALDPPVMINHPFYAGFLLPLASEDSLAVYSNTDGDTTPGTAWDWWENGSWIPISDPTSWILNLSMGIHPIVEYQTGIEDKKVVSFNVFPNPTNGGIKIDLTEFMKDLELNLYNVDGQKVMSTSIQGNLPSHTLDLSGYPRGIYFLRIFDSEKTGNQKIILR